MTSGHTNLKATDKDGGEVSVSHTTTDAPILPANNLAQLKQIDPKLVDWVITQTEKESTHRRERQVRVDKYLFIERVGGLFFGALVALVGLGIAAYLAMNGHDIVAAVIGGSTLVGLVSVLVARTHATAKANKPTIPTKPQPTEKVKQRRQNVKQK